MAAISIVAYTGVQARANNSKIDADMSNLKKAINLARAKDSIALRYVTNSTASGASCWSKPTGTDLATLPKSDACWINYEGALNLISNASGMNVRNLIDPYGRPYYIDENEGEGVDPATACGDDYIGVYAQPFTTGQTMNKHTTIANIQPACF